jgi:hypothetical protein
MLPSLPYEEVAVAGAKNPPPPAIQRDVAYAADVLVGEVIVHIPSAVGVLVPSSRIWLRVGWGFPCQGFVRMRVCRRVCCVCRSLRLRLRRALRSLSSRLVRLLEVKFVEAFAGGWFVWWTYALPFSIMKGWAPKDS